MDNGEGPTHPIHLNASPFAGKVLGVKRDRCQRMPQTPTIEAPHEIVRDLLGERKPTLTVGKKTPIRRDHHAVVGLRRRKPHRPLAESVFRPHHHDHSRTSAQGKQAG